ncbi:hypothetical protein M5X06_21955 [Paenibacillus alvei]|uniref:Uncharacterized protein n=1 Tax=Paenibacillus alvei TaxID=44250 RepID=A0ABT4H3K4_PAEAL|nr:hypothetical protein [Paenibacillus alvei]MCY9763257.1 hypothetical protein [Paenibacillus alvei]MCY9769454.1 hypothetical protein [Paenibacillus alvei]
MKKIRPVKKIKIKMDDTELSKPTLTVKNSLLRKSAAMCFDEAKSEWNLDTLIDSTCDDFSAKCQLCNTPGLKVNFVLSNNITGEKLRVGSTCIIRFGLGKGIYDTESGVTMLQNMADEYELINSIQTMVLDVMLLIPDPSILRKFCEKLRKVMQLKGIKNPSDEQLKIIFWGQNASGITDRYQLARMRMLWDKPGMIETQKRKRLPVQSQPKEGTTFGHKRRTRVQTSLGTSSIYRDPYRKSN